MIRCTEDFHILEGKQTVYIYGAKNIAKRLYPVLKDRGYNIKGFLVTVPENNKEELYGLPIMHVSEVLEEREEAYIVVGVNPKFRREIVGSLLNYGFYHIVMLHESYVALLRDKLPQEIMDYFAETDYTPFFSDEVEESHSVLCNLNNPQRFKARIQTGWWFTQTKKYMNKRECYGHVLADKFENVWGPYNEVSHAQGSAKTDKELMKKCNFYSVRCHVDRPVDLSEIPQYMTEIQAGAALTHKNICKVKDNTGDNISERNRDFSECSAFYWIWKNQEKKEYTGVCHYRRHLAVSSASLLEEMNKGRDLVNTIPTIMYPSIGYFFDYNFFYERDCELMIEGIAKLHPEYMVDTYKLGKGEIYLANNIFVMKTEWFDKMCEFVFDVILYIDDFYREKGFVRQDRYAGYFFEYLYSIFIMHHAKEMDIAYTNMKFLQ